MKRKIYAKMLEWKRLSNGKSALMIKGARRIGKSWICEDFAKREYESYILVDFNEEDDEFVERFLSLRADLDSLFFFLQRYYGVTLKERKSAIIFDEVQKQPIARQMIKYLVKDGRYDYIETGSLITISSTASGITIPSEEQTLEMHPMDFEEFLWAKGDELLWGAAEKAFQTRTPVGQPLHRRLMERFCQYFVTGGMPQAVEAFVNTNDYSAVDQIKKNILALYKEDIKKADPRLVPKLAKVFSLIPVELSRENKKFAFCDIAKGSGAKDTRKLFDWLVDAGLVNICTNHGIPDLITDESTFKCYLCDTGLLLTHAFDENEEAMADVMRKLALNKLEVNKGMLMENMVGQMLVASGRRLYFHSSYSRAAEDRMEVDFLIAKSSITNRHNICPIEVKSSTRYTLTSLRKFVSKFSQYSGTAYVLHMNDVEERDGFVFLPLYMTPLL